MLTLIYKLKIKIYMKYSKCLGFEFGCTLSESRGIQIDLDHRYAMFCNLYLLENAVNVIMLGFMKGHPVV